MPRKSKVCACGKPLRDGRCTAFPSCDDFRKPGLRARSTEARQRENERRGASVVGLPPMQVRAALAKVDPIYAHHHEKASERARTGWRTRR